MGKFKKILFILTNKEKRHALFLLVMVLIMALLEMVGVASIMPFMSVLTNPEVVESNNFLNSFYKSSSIFGIKDKKEFLFFLGILVMLMLVLSLIFKAITLIFQIRFSSKCQYRLSKTFIENYLNQPYVWILNRHSAELGKTILSEINVVISKGLKPLITLITQLAVIFTLITLLIIVNPKPAIIIGVAFGLIYFTIYRLIRSLLTKIGKERLMSNEMRFKLVIDAFGAFKEIKINRLEKIFVNRFSKYSKIFAKHQASSQIIPMLPRFFLEAIAFGGMLLVILFLMRQSNNFTNTLPLIILYAFAGYRLLPAFQLIYSSVAQLRLVGPSLDSVYDDLKYLDPIQTQENKNTISFNKNLTLNKIKSSYPNSTRISLEDLNLEIPANSKIGLVGTTGSGKTTIIDIILGLLEAQKGTVEIDGKKIDRQNIRAWQKSIGYVPQQIFLLDDTIESNIAFGIDPENINHDSVQEAARIANLHKFISEELPLKYKTKLGERGIKFSGGQRQRVGIARALYSKPKLLILDEATSSLDNLTEKAVMESVNNLNKDITIILIAHRLSTVKNCENIYVLENGKIKNSGTFDELSQINELFQ